jgi:hypothetical protein
MANVDSNNLFSMCVAMISTADALSQDASISADLNAAAGRLRDAMKSWKGVAYAFRDVTPPTTGGASK